MYEQIFKKEDSYSLNLKTTDLIHNSFDDADERGDETTVKFV